MSGRKVPRLPRKAGLSGEDELSRKPGPRGGAGLSGRAGRWSDRVLITLFSSAAAVATALVPVAIALIGESPDDRQDGQPATPGQTSIPAGHDATSATPSGPARQPQPPRYVSNLMTLRAPEAAGVSTTVLEDDYRQTAINGSLANRTTSLPLRFEGNDEAGIRVEGEILYEIDPPYRDACGDVAVNVRIVDAQGSAIAGVDLRKGDVARELSGGISGGTDGFKLTLTVTHAGPGPCAGIEVLWKWRLVGLRP